MRKGPRKFTFAFEKSGLTRFGGLALYQSFCRSFATAGPAVQRDHRCRYPSVDDLRSQGGVARGYIPKRRHTQSSYAPILSSEGRSGLSLGMELRAGNVHSSTGAGEFLNLVLDKLPSSIATARTRLRLDGAFYDREIIDPLENQGLGDVVVARLTPPLKKRMLTVRFQEFACGWEAAQFTYTPWHWKREHRFVAVRRPVAMESEEIQLRLFTFKSYTYHRVMVTNLDRLHRRFGAFTATAAFRSC